MQTIFYDEKSIKSMLTDYHVEEIDLNMDKDTLYVTMIYNDNDKPTNSTNYGLGKLTFEFYIDEYGDASTPTLVNYDKYIVAKSRSLSGNYDILPNEDDPTYEDIVNKIVEQFNENVNSDFKCGLLEYLDIPYNFSEYVLNVEYETRNYFSKIFNNVSVEDAGDYLQVTINNTKAFQVYAEDIDRIGCRIDPTISTIFTNEEFFDFDMCDTVEEAIIPVINTFKELSHKIVTISKAIKE